MGATALMQFYNVPMLRLRAVACSLGAPAGQPGPEIGEGGHLDGRRGLHDSPFETPWLSGMTMAVDW